jgi:hypothetical protein
MTQRRKTWLLGMLALFVLSACVQPPEKPAEPTPSAAPAELPPQCTPAATRAGSQVLAIDTAHSAIEIYVYPAGRLAHLGHTHIISINDIQGFIEVAEPLQQSRLALCLPVESLIVDDPELRAAAGVDFVQQPSAVDIAGTYRNMLSKTQLNGERFPYLVVTGSVINARPAYLDLNLKYDVQEHILTAPARVSWKRTQGGLTAWGELNLNLTDLGIEPFSTLFGALRVRDRLALRFALTAFTANQ